MGGVAAGRDDSEEEGVEGGDGGDGGLGAVVTGADAARARVVLRVWSETGIEGV